LQKEEGMHGSLEERIAHVGRWIARVEKVLVELEAGNIEPAVQLAKESIARNRQVLQSLCAERDRHNAKRRSK
jgi:hypothetical protein